MKEYSLDRFSSLPPMGCPRCAVVDRPFVTSGSGPHAAAARWQHGGRHVRWLATRTPGERQARRHQSRQQAMSTLPPSTKQPALLQRRGDVGPVPANMWGAHQRIEVLVCGEVQP
jgi:hypothetical protein